MSSSAGRAAWVRHATARQVVVRSLKVALVVGTVLALFPMLLVSRLNTRMGVSDHWFALSDDVAEAFASQLSMMPIMVAIARVCPEGDEGMIYAGFMSISNIGGALSTWGGAALTHALGITKDDYSNMLWLLVLCTLTNLVPYFYVHLLPNDDADAREATTHATHTVDLQYLVNETEPPLK